MKISQKLISGFTGVALSIVIVGGIAIYYQNEIIRNNALREINRINYRFSSLEERDTKILSAVLKVFSHNQAFKDVYLEKDREKLYNYGQPLFQEIKNGYEVTHFYFILPDGHCFVRLHDKDIYGDLITRYTFCKARDTKNIAFGMELGKTAFALRVVMPYYNNSELIGYVEIGEEINHFLKILKGRTDSEFLILVHKEYLDKEDWKSVRQTAGLRNDWDDLEQHVVIANTLEKGTEALKKFFIEKTCEKIKEGKILLGQVKVKNKIFANGGFEIKNAKGKNIGAVLALIDITDSIAIAQKAKDIILAIIVILLILCLNAGYFISRSILNPIIKLMQATIKIGKGELDTRIKIESKDELGYLASSFNKMADDLQKTTTSIGNLNKEITERKKAENTLWENQERYRALVENTILGVTIIDTNYKIIMVNTMLTKLFNKPASDFVGKNCFMEYEKREAVCPHCPGLRAMASGKTTEVETQGVRDDGSRFYVRNRAIPFFGPDGVVKGFIELIEDITERKKTENELREAYVKLKETQDQLIQAEKLNAVGQLASGVAHEVRNPLGIILQGVNYLEKRISGKEEDISEILIMLKDSVKRADKIINALLDFSRAASLDLEPEDVSSILESSISLVKTKFNLENINIIMETKKDIPKAFVDKNKLEQVFINILLNAAQAMPNGGKIIIRNYDKKLEKITNGIGRREDDYFQVGENAVIIEIEDTGSGISEENLKKIFDPFFTTKGPTGGSGLGLSVTRNIVSMHKGLIDIKSQIGKGTTVTIILKIAKR